MTFFCNIKIIIYMSVLFLVEIRSLWNCPIATDSQQQRCLSIPNSWPIDSNFFTNTQQTFLSLWECNYNCICDYDYMLDLEGNCVPCSSSISNHKIPVPTILSTCDVNTPQFLCEQGYFYSITELKCVQCVVHDDNSRCSLGTYYERCQENNNMICKPCQNAIPNTTSQQYGEYNMLPACTSTNRFNLVNGIPNCALYMTPLWNQYECSIECKDNYILDVHAICVPCYEVCSVGQYCDGTNCNECPGTLEANEIWLPDTNINDPSCRPACDEGYYKSTLTGKCLPCLHQSCFNTSYIFLGCNGFTAGHCQTTDLKCVMGETFLFYQVISHQAECRYCSLPTQGLTFTSSNCTLIKDTSLQNCQVVCHFGFFKIKNCTLNSDIVCQSCSDPLAKMGSLMVGSCGGEKDYTFATCPDGYSCDGSTKIYTCLWPMTAVQGICKCPYGTYLRGEKCTVVQCPSGQYPHVETGVCIPCSTAHSITLDNVWGKDACACEVGFFIQNLIQNTTTDYPIKCWPCGDLTCVSGMQYQTPCPGTLTEEPDCQCREPMGVSLNTNISKCIFSSCENGLDKTISFDAMASTSPPILWNGSFWVNTNEKIDTLLVEDAASFQITSMTMINQNTLIYVLNHKELWITVKNDENHTWTKKALINNALFIYGNRNFSNNKLIDINVCRDKKEGRFWLSFVMLTTLCGNVDNDNMLNLCSNFELIEIRKFVQSESPCIPVIQINDTNVLCAENMYRIWGKSIGDGIPTKQISSMTMNYFDDVIGLNQLYMVMGGYVVQSYVIQYYEPDVQQDQRNDDHLTTLIVRDQSDDITCMVWVSTHLFALVNGYLTALTPPQDFTGVQIILQKFKDIKLLYLQQHGVILSAIAAKPENRIYEIDSSNGYFLDRNTPRNNIYIFNHFSIVIEVNRYQNHFFISTTTTMKEKQCPMDYISYNDNTCVLLPCLLLKNACGDNSLRAIGSITCSCIPGHFMESVSKHCQICPNGFYCPGDIIPQSCQSNSYSISGATTSTQCLCNRGYYKFKENMCISCPKGFWCYGDYMPPVRCTSGSSTALIATQNPVDCLCQSRTHSIDCQPCANKDVCMLLGSQQSPYIASVFLSGSGPIDADMILNQTCLGWGVNNIVYNLPWTITQERVGTNGKVWSWVIVVEYLQQFENEDNIIANISSCMILNGFKVDLSYVYSRFKITSNVQHALPCGLNYEWSGDSSTGQQCTCIGGYYETSDATSGLTWCSPCAIDSIRKTRSSISNCMPCQDNNSHAPWLAMDHCVCKEGYFLDNNQIENKKICTYLGMGINGYDTISSPFLLIPLTIALSILSLLSLYLFSFIML